MASTWKAFIDLDGDGVWDAGDDISADVKTLSFSNGFQKPFRSMTDENECVIQVDNTDGKYNPENSGSSFYGRLQVQRRVKIEHVGASSSGLLANWELSDAVGSSTVKAYPDSGYGGSPSNLTLGADGIGDGKTAATFDGSSSVVNIFSSDLASNFDGSEGTLAAWAKVSGAGIWSDSASHVIAVIYADVNNFVFIYKAASNVLAATFRANGFNGTVVYSTTTADWFHVALTWDGSLITLYFNGVQAYQRNDALTWSGIPTLALIGNYWAGSQYWSGDVQHVLLANRAFSGDEIAALYARQVAYTVALYEQPMWVGWIEKIDVDWQVSSSLTGKNTATLHCIGAREYLQNEEINLPLLENYTATELLEYMLTGVQIPPIVEGVWLAEKPGFSEAGVTTFAADISAFTDFDDDDYTFQYFPPQRSVEPEDKVAARSALKSISQVVEAVRGYFYFSRDGKAVFRGHDWLMSNTLRSLSINTASAYEPVQVRYVSGEYLANTVAVKIFPRSSGSSLTLYTLAAPVTVSAGSTKTFEAPFVDSNFIETGAENVSIDTETYSSGEATASIEVLADRALVTVDNTAGSVDAVLSVFILTGEPLRGDKSVVIRKSDTASQGNYGRRRDLTLNLRALDDYSRAEEIAGFELYRRKDARSEISHVTFFNAADGSDNVFQIGRGIGDRIRVVADEVGHDADYYIVGEKHVLEQGLNFHRTVWTLEPQAAHVVWLAGIDGYSNAGTSTYAGY